MKRSWVILAFGLSELAIGVIALATESLRLFSDKFLPPLPVRVFVLAAAMISVTLGIGILRRNFTAYKYIVFFSAVIVLSKVLALFRIISISTALETSFRQPYLNLVSVFYHSLLILYFYRPCIRKEFEAG